MSALDVVETSVVVDLDGAEDDVPQGTCTRLFAVVIARQWRIQHAYSTVLAIVSIGATVMKQEQEQETRKEQDAARERVDVADLVVGSVWVCLVNTAST